MSTLTVLSTQQVSLVLGMLYECRKNDMFTQDEHTLVSETEALFERLEEQISNSL